MIWLKVYFNIQNKFLFHFSTRWPTQPRHPYLIFMDMIRIALLISLIPKLFGVIPFMLPVGIWIFHDVIIIFTFCMLSSSLILRKLYICYGSLSYFAGLQIRVGLILNCYKQCDSEQALFYIAFLIPLLYGVAPAVLISVYLAQLPFGCLSQIQGGDLSVRPSPATIMLLILIAIMGFLSLITLPVIVENTVFDVWTFKASFFVIMLVLTAVIMLYKSYKDGKYTQMSPLIMCS